MSVRACVRACVCIPFMQVKVTYNFYVAHNIMLHIWNAK